MIQPDKGDWTKIVGRSLREAEEKLPDGGWDRLERELRAFPLSAPQGSPKRNWIKYTVAAASILVCASIGVQIWRVNQHVSDSEVVFLSGTAQGEDRRSLEKEERSIPSGLEQISKVAVAEGSDPNPVAGNRAAGQRLNRDGVAAANATSRPTKSARHPLAERTELGVGSDRHPAGDGVAVHIDPGSSLRKPVPQPVLTKTEKRYDEKQYGVRSAQAAAVGSQRELPSYRSADYNGLFAETTPVVRKKSGAAGVFASGALGGSGTMRIGLGPVYSSIIVDKKEVNSLRDAYEDYSFDHKQPLSFGLTFRKEFKYGFSLETGLNYTLLRSDVTVTGRMKKIYQNLHFVGIPLRVNWQFVQAGRFTMYVGAGGMAEKCVSACFGTEKATERSIQWSVSGLLGAQCRLGRSVGIYFEPSVSHYLTHTSLRTAYTDSKAVVDLRIGLRLTY